MLNTLSNFFEGFVSSLPSTFTEGLLWGILALGVYISYRILDVPDMSVDGTLALGGVISAVLTANGWNAFLTLPISIIAGGLAGAITALMHTKLKIPAILSGILTMFALYSVNIHIMGNRSSQSLIGHTTISDMLASLFGNDARWGNLLLGVVCVGILIGLLYWFFGTQLGSSIRATGCNTDMARAQGINTDNMKILGLTISNAIASFAGALLTQTQGSADVNMASGTIVIGLASVVIGEIIFGKRSHFALKLTGAVTGSIIYRLILVVALLLGMPTTDLKLISAVLVVLALSLPFIKEKVQRIKFGKKHKNGDQPLPDTAETACDNSSAQSTDIEEDK